jgi:3-hydroxybutyryl-CoA dehydrogenase
MRVAVLAAEGIKKELFTKNIPSSVELTIVESINALLAADAEVYFDLAFECEIKRLKELAPLLPRPVFVNSVVHTLREIGEPFMRINAWPTFLERDICEVVAGAGQHAQLKAVFEKLKWSFRLAPDVTGMISPRIVAAIINEAFYALDEQVSTKKEIDIAMKLGTSYPYGPFEWAEKIGLQKIYMLLLELGKTDGRYTIAKSLEKEMSSQCQSS